MLNDATEMLFIEIASDLVCIYIFINTSRFILANYQVAL